MMIMIMVYMMIMSIIMKTCSGCAESSDKGPDNDAKGEHQVQVAKRNKVGNHLGWISMLFILSR